MLLAPLRRADGEPVILRKLRVAADKAYQNARQNSDKQNARIEHDKALGRVMTAVLKDDTELFKQFMDNESSGGG